MQKLSPTAPVSSAVVDLFAGPGGTDVGFESLRSDILTGPSLEGLSLVGFEIDAHANATATAAGHRRVVGDVRQWRDIFEGKYITGLIASPPCQGFSFAGLGKGRDDSRVIMGALSMIAANPRWVSTPLMREVISQLDTELADARSALVLEPLLWAVTYAPKWIALEQVPAVLPVWEMIARILRRRGYSVATGIVHPEQYGIAQTRPRAVLLASIDHEVTLPAVTHAKFRRSGVVPEGLHPPVAMNTVLAREGKYTMHHRRGSGMRARHGERPGRTQDEPSFAVTGARGGGSCRLYVTDEVTGQSTALHVLEAAALQTFPHDYPWQGGVSSIRRQIGDAVPPRLAALLLKQVIS